MEVLTERGMELEMLRETMRWVTTRKQHPLPRETSLSALARFARGLVLGDQQELEAPWSPKPTKNQAAAAIL
eukprot:1068640-Amphidinium_carterae.1